MGDNSTIWAKKSIEDSRFLGIYLREKRGYDHISKRLKETIADFNRQLINKKMTSSLHTYLANWVLIPKLEYLHQTAILSERTLTNLYKPVLGSSKKIAGLPRSINNNIMYHIGFHGLMSLADNYSETHITNILRRLNSNQPDGITTRIRLEDARLSEASPTSLIHLPDRYHLAKHNLLHNLALFEIVLCDNKGIKIQDIPNWTNDTHRAHKPTQINTIIYNHLSSLPTSPTKNTTINNTLKSLPKISELGLLHNTDLMVPGQNVTKSWHHINYEKTGHVKKGKIPKWYSILIDHITNNIPPPCPTSSTNSHKPLSHKQNKLQWAYDFSHYGKISFGRIIKKSHPARNSQTIFYSHWIPIDSTHKHYTTLHNNSNAQLIQCPECNKGLSGSPNFARSR